MDKKSPKTTQNTTCKRNKKAAQYGLPGAIYLNKNRYWWKVQLPGEDRPAARPLKPLGAKYATTDYSTAVECAKLLLEKSLFASQQPVRGAVTTIAELVRAYMGFARGYYVDPDGQPTREAGDIQYALGPLVDACATLPIEQFGPLKLKAVREMMIDKKWSRKLINKRVNIIRRMFRWGVSEQLVSSMILYGLQSVPGLKQGRTRAKETEDVKPVEEKYV